MQKNRYKNVAVIGAGPSGLVAVKSLLEQGLDPVAFDKAAEIGGLWRFDETQPDGGGVAYRSLMTNTSKWMGVFSDMPFKEDAPDFPSREELLGYLNRYADTFNLRPHIRLNTTVKRVAPTPDGRWEISTLADGEDSVQIFDAVVIASGFYPLPYQPDMPGLGDFKGKVLHSYSYKGPESFEGKRVIVVGCGSSGADISGELGSVAKMVDVSTRAGVWFVPKMMKNRAYDTYRTRFSMNMPPFISNFFFRKLLLKSYHKLGLDNDALERLQLPAFEPGKAKFLPATEILIQAREGTLRMKPEIAAVGQNEVRYVDGTVSPADVILFATGYKLHFPFLDEEILCVKGRYTIGVYRQVFHRDYDNLAFLAMNFAGGSAFPLMEIQARWLARVFSGDMALPPSASRGEWIDAYFAKHEAAGTDPMSLQLLKYLGEMGELLGVDPQMWNHPGLVGKLIFGAHIPAQYRLDGPGKSPQAAAVIAEQGYLPEKN